MIRAVMFGVVLAAMAATAAPAQSGGTLAAIDPAGPRILKIACGENRSVDVSLETGAVTFRNCEANEAARVFWDSVRRMYPPRAMKAGGDSSCTTWGTTVTGGGGALNLLLWNNGANWTLVGK